MRKFISWKYTLIILSLLGLISTMPISNNKVSEDAYDNQNLDISFNNSVSSELSQNIKNFDNLNEKDTESQSQKGIYIGDVIENSNEDITQNYNESNEVKEYIPDKKSSNDTINEKSNNIIVDDKNTSYKTSNPNKTTSKDSNYNNSNKTSDENIKTEYKENTKTNDNINDKNNNDINNNGDNVRVVESINGNTGNNNLYIESPDNSNSYELEKFNDTKKAIYASGVIMGILLFFVVGNFVMKVRANYEIKNQRPGDRSLSIDSFELGVGAEDINSLLSLETMEQYSENNQAYVIDNDNKKKNIAKIYEIKGIKDNIFSRPSDNRNSSVNSLFRLSTNDISITYSSMNGGSNNTTVSLNTINTSDLF